MTKFIGAIAGLLVGLLLCHLFFTGVFEVDWTNADHRGWVIDMLGWGLSVWETRHLMFIASCFGAIVFLLICTVCGTVWLGAPLIFLARKTPLLGSLLRPLKRPLAAAGRVAGKLLKIRMPRPQIEARLEWTERLPARPVGDPVGEPSIQRSTDIMELGGNPDADTAPNQNSIPAAPVTPPPAQEAKPEDNGLVFHDPMAAPDNPEPLPSSDPVGPSYDPSRSLPRTIDMLRDLGYDTRTNLQVDARLGGWAEDIFDNDPLATVELMAVDSTAIYLVQTIDLAKASWNVTSMLDSDTPSWTSDLAEIECPARALARIKARFCSAFLARMNMRNEDVIPVLLLANGKIDNQQSLINYADGEGITVSWIDHHDGFTDVFDQAAQPMEAWKLAMITNAQRQVA